MEEKDVWIFGPERRLLIVYSNKSISHPAKMSLHLCREIIKRYSKKGDLILDVMAGIGTTCVEGMILGRRCIAIEYEQKFVDMAQANIDLTKRKMGFMKDFGSAVVIKGDSRELSKLLAKGGENIILSGRFPFANTLAGSSNDDTEKFTHGSAGKDYGQNPDNLGNMQYGKIDSIITSPPYGETDNQSRNKEDLTAEKNQRDIIGKKYSEDENNIGNKQGKNYLTEMLKVYRECRKVLKNNGFMVLVTKNFVRSGEQIRLDLDTIKLCEAAGFTYVRRHYRKINNPSFWITNAIQKWEKKHSDKPHPYPLAEDVLVFQKCISKNISEGEDIELIDTIAFSPPFADQQHVTQKMVEEGKMTPTAKKKYGYSDHYSSDPDNIGNLKYKK